MQAILQSDVTFTMAENEGKGYNVVGVLEGSDPSLAPVLLASHVDAHFRAGLDDTGAVVNELLTAKAMTMSGVQPRRTVIFFFTCAEEYGYTNCWYDWAIGSWYAITQEHPDWAGKIALMLNIELIAEKGAPPQRSRRLPTCCRSSSRSATESEDVLPWGFTSQDCQHLDRPVELERSGRADGFASRRRRPGVRPLLSHRLREQGPLVDHDYLGGIAKWNYRVIAGLRRGLLPYDLIARGDQLLANVSPGKLVRAGVNQRMAADFKIAATKFRAAARKWEARKADTADEDVAAVNDALLALEKTINATFTSRDAYDFSAYPHVQGQIDGFYLAKAITAAKAGNSAQAKKWITYVGINWYLRYLQRGGVPGGPLPALPQHRAHHVGDDGDAPVRGRRERRLAHARAGRLRRGGRRSQGRARCGARRPAGQGGEHDVRPQGVDRRRESSLRSGGGVSKGHAGRQSDEGRGARPRRPAPSRQPSGVTRSANSASSPRSTAV